MQKEGKRIQMKTNIMWIACVVLLSLVSRLEAVEIRLYTTIALPSQRKEDGKMLERSLETLNCIADKLPDYHFTVRKAVWERVLADKDTESVEGWFGFGDLHDSQQDLNATQSVPIALEKWYWFTNADSPLNVRRQHVPVTTEIGTLQDAYTHQWLMREGYTQIQPARSFQRILDLLETNKIDVILADEMTFQQYTRTLQLDAAQFQRLFLRYAPFSVYFTRTFLTSHPDFLHAFNTHVAACVLDVGILSENEHMVLENIMKSVNVWSHDPTVLVAW